MASDIDFVLLWVDGNDPKWQQDLMKYKKQQNEDCATSEVRFRDWLYVLDHCKGIDLVFHSGKNGETYNIGGRNERTNLQIVNKICEILDEKARHCGLDPQSEVINRHSELDSESKKSYKDLISFVEDRAGHDKRYAIDASKIEKELGWKAEENFDSGIVKTVDWYLGKYRK